MFDLSFWEIMMIGIIAVIVVGPERLPGMAYTAGKWLTKVKRFVANAKAEVESEFNTVELRNLLSAQEEEMQKLRKLVEDTRHDVEQSQHALIQAVDDAAQSVREASSPHAEAEEAATPRVDNAPVSLSKTQASPVSNAELPTPKPALEAILPAMTAQTIEDEMQSLSQSLGETLHRPSFGASHEAVSPATTDTAPPKARA